MEARTRENETLDYIKARSEEKGSFLLSASIEATSLKKAEADLPWSNAYVYVQHLGVQDSHVLGGGI